MILEMDTVIIGLRILDFLLHFTLINKKIIINVLLASLLRWKALKKGYLKLIKDKIPFYYHLVTNG